MKQFKIIVTVALYFFARFLLAPLYGLDMLFMSTSQSKLLLLLIIVVVASLYIIIARILIKHIERLVKPLMVFSYGMFIINIGLYIANIAQFFIYEDLAKRLPVKNSLGFLASLVICVYFLKLLNETRKTLQEEQQVSDK